MKTFFQAFIARRRAENFIQVGESARDAEPRVSERDLFCKKRIFPIVDCLAPPHS